MQNRDIELHINTNISAGAIYKYAGVFCCWKPIVVHGFFAIILPFMHKIITNYFYDDCKEID